MRKLLLFITFIVLTLFIVSCENNEVEEVIFTVTFDPNSYDVISNNDINIDLSFKIDDILS